MNDVVISAKGLTKRYRMYQHPLDRLKEALHPLRRSYHTDFTALQDVSFELRSGETVGLIGRNGAGKSTLLKILTSVTTPTSGEFSVRGRVSSLLELGTGFNPELSGIENVFFNGLIFGLSRPEMEKRLPAIVEFADISEFINRPVKFYSSGMFARLAFAVAYHIDPDVLIIDEALAVGDMMFQKKCLERFHTFRKRGTTILFVSHDPYQVKGFCQRALYLRNGELAAFGESDRVTDTYLYDLERSMVRTKATTQLADGKDAAADVSAECTGRAGFIQITDVKLLNDLEQEIQTVRCGQRVLFRFWYKLSGDFDGDLSFVFNIYRHDDLYICGATSAMDKLPPFKPHERGCVTVIFDKFPLLAGRFKWRAAVNDGSGLAIFTEAVPVCEFTVVDGFDSVGIVHLDRRWVVEGWSGESPVPSRTAENMGL